MIGEDDAEVVLRLERQLETGCDSGIVQSTDEESNGRLGVDESDGDGGVALTPSPEFVVTSTDGHQSLMSIDIPPDGFGMFLFV